MTQTEFRRSRIQNKHGIISLKWLIIGNNLQFFYLVASEIVLSPKKAPYGIIRLHFCLSHLSHLQESVLSKRGGGGG